MTCGLCASQAENSGECVRAHACFLSLCNPCHFSFLPLITDQGFDFQKTSPFSVKQSQSDTMTEKCRGVNTQPLKLIPARICSHHGAQLSSCLRSSASLRQAADLSQQKQSKVLFGLPGRGVQIKARQSPNNMSVIFCPKHTALCSSGMLYLFYCWSCVQSLFALKKQMSCFTVNLYVALM